jgi:hypothetical protein
MTRNNQTKACIAQNYPPSTHNEAGSPASHPKSAKKKPGIQKTRKSGPNPRHKYPQFRRNIIG